MVVDSGVSPNADLPVEVFGVDTNTGTVALNDHGGHGTHVAGIIGATGNNSVGVTGVAWNVQLMSIKFIGTNGGAVYEVTDSLFADWAWQTEGETVFSSPAVANGWVYAGSFDDQLYAFHLPS